MYTEYAKIQCQVDFVKDMQMDGPCWRMAITDSNSTQVKDNIEEIIQKWAGDKFSMAMVMKITMWSKMAFEQWKEEKDRKPSATSASQNLLSLKDLHSIKVPEPPEGNGLGGRISAEQVKSYIEALSAVFNMIDKEYSDRLLATLKSPTLEVLAICLQDMTSKSMQLDQLVGKTFMLKPLEKTMASIIAFKQHTDGEGRYSGLRIVQAMCAATTQLTGARLGELLKSVFKPLTDVPGEIQQLEPNYKMHSEALTALGSLDHL